MALFGDFRFVVVPVCYSIKNHQNRITFHQNMAL